VSDPRPHNPGHFEVGGACPHCSETLEPGARIVSCPRCGITQHESCWGLHDGCGSYHCIPGDRFDARGASPDVVVRPEDLDAVTAERLAGPRALHRPAAAPREPEKPEKTSRMALWAFGLGVAGLPFAGCPGVVATVLGGMALARIGASRGRLGGTGWAVGGIALGLLASVGWIAAGAIWFAGRQDPFETEFPREIRLEGTPKPIADALRRTVFVEGSDAPGLLSKRRRWIGSGILLGVRDGRATVLTNRHVALGDDAKEGAERPVLRVRFIDGEILTATVRWLAPGKADLALITCEAPPSTVEGAAVSKEAVPSVGDGVFAVGNPRGFGWTFTQGVVSGFSTTRTAEGRTVEVIQTQTPISPGSSGGGLYDEAGRLVGINTWTASGGGTEGIHFAISARALAGLLEETGEKVP
jgi:S1-C subfamily serine protease